MIKGVGIDLCDISRMEKSMQNPHFMERYFTPEERAYIASRGACAAASAAGVFAAKEALLKALGTGLSGIPLASICIAHRPTGAPYYAFTNEAAQAVAGCRAHLSITHDGGMAAAVAVVEDEKGIGIRE